MLNNGDVFAGFMIERLLGQGGMGSVYLARHPRLPRLTALKLLNRELFADTEVRARFEREADLAAQLDHPNIVAVYDRGAEADQLWISMQYVDGVDAASVNPTTLPPERAVQIIEGTAAALDYAHGNGVLHRDVKPANIMLARSSEGGKSERVFLTDFGIARLRADSTHLTQAGMFTATLAYASPEQMTGAELDGGSDQYSLACALYWLLCGIGPFDSEHPTEVIRGHLQLAAPSVSARRPGLSPALDAVLARALAKRPSERYRSCSEFAAAAAQALTAPVGVGYPASAATVLMGGQPPAAVPAPPMPLGAAASTQMMPPAAPMPRQPYAPGPAQDGSLGVPANPVAAPQYSVPSPHYGQPTPGYPPSPGMPQPMPGYASNHGVPQPMPRRSRGAVGWILGGVGLLLVVAIVVVVVVFAGNGSHGGPAKVAAGAPKDAPTLAGLHQAFPQLAPAPTKFAGVGSGFDGKQCFPEQAGGTLFEHPGNDGGPALTGWAAAWDCWGGDTEKPDYVVLAYKSAADVRAVLNGLPPNRQIVAQNNNGKSYTTYRWNSDPATSPVTYHIMTAFGSDPARADYLVYCNEQYWDLIHSGLSGPAFGDWWKTLPLGS